MGDIEKIISVAFTFLFLSVCYCLEISKFFIHGKRLVGSMLLSKGNQGPQMCISDCQNGMAGCNSINYNRNDFICEFNKEDGGDVANQTTFQNNAGFFFVNMRDLFPHFTVSSIKSFKIVL